MLSWERDDAAAKSGGGDRPPAGVLRRGGGECGRDFDVEVSRDSSVDLPDPWAAGLCGPGPAAAGCVLSKVMCRSMALRSVGSFDDSLIWDGRRGFLALNGEKVNGRVYCGRPVQVDYRFSLDSAGKHVVLGHGMSGNVREAFRRHDGRCCAVKSFEKSRLDECQMLRLRNEAQIFLEVDHPNIVRLLGCYEDDRELHFVMERCVGGEVQAELASKQRYGEQRAAHMVRQMLTALIYLHEHSVVHRDLKLQNWMLEDSTGLARVKLIDFGLSRIWDPEDMHGPMSRSCGTTGYMAPEVLDSHYSHKADLWSLGVIVYLLLSGRYPFGSTALYSCDSLTAELLLAPAGADVRGTLERGGGWGHISVEAHDFVTRLLVHDPSRRMTAYEALDHPWLHLRARPAARAGEGVLRGLRRFARLGPAMKVLLVQLAYGSRWAEGAMNSFAELFVQRTESRGTLQFEDLAGIAREADASVGTEEVLDLYLSMAASSRGSSAGLSAVPAEVGYSEFLAAALPCVYDDAKLAAEIFWMLDADHDGRVSRAELAAALENTAAAADAAGFVGGVAADEDGFFTEPQLRSALLAGHD